MQNAKVLFFVNNFSEKPETFIYNLATGLQFKGVDVLVVCLNRKNQITRPFDQVKVIKQFKLLTKFNNFTSRYYFNRINVAYYIQLRKILKEFKPDIIHCHFGNQAYNLLDNFSKNLPIVISFHGYDASYLLKKNVKYLSRLQHTFNKANVYPIFCSKALRSNLEKHGVSSPNSQIIHYGVKLYQNASLQKNEKKIAVQISRLVAKKGTIFTLKAIKHLKDSNEDLSLHFIIGGEGPLKEELKDFCRKNKLDNIVEFVGWLDEEKRNRILSKADIFIQHSITSVDDDMEGLPNAIIEAMSFELPILSTFHSGIPEIVEHQVNGLLSNEGDYITFSKNLQEILKWDKQTVNREKVIRKFSHKMYIDNHINLYTKLLS